MDLQAQLREGLHKTIDQINDVSILQAVSILLEREKQHEERSEDFYETLSPSLKASIDRGLAQIENGETISHDEVRKRYERWLK